MQTFSRKIVTGQHAMFSYAITPLQMAHPSPPIMPQVPTGIQTTTVSSISGITRPGPARGRDNRGGRREGGASGRPPRGHPSPDVGSPRAVIHAVQSRSFEVIGTESPRLIVMAEIRAISARAPSVFEPGRARFRYSWFDGSRMQG